MIQMLKMVASMDAMVPDVHIQRTACLKVPVPDLKGRDCLLRSTCTKRCATATDLPQRFRKRYLSPHIRREILHFSTISEHLEPDLEHSLRERKRYRLRRSQLENAAARSNYCCESDATAAGCRRLPGEDRPQEKQPASCLATLRNLFGAGESLTLRTSTNSGRYRTIGLRSS